MADHEKNGYSLKNNNYLINSFMKVFRNKKK